MRELAQQAIGRLIVSLNVFSNRASIFDPKDFYV